MLMPHKEISWTDPLHQSLKLVQIPLQHIPTYCTPVL